MTHGGASLHPEPAAAAETQIVAQLSQRRCTALCFGFCRVFSASKVSAGEKGLCHITSVASGDGHGHTVTHMLVTVIVMIECLS